MRCSTVGLRDIVSDELCWRAHAKASAAHQVPCGQLSKGENGKQCRHVGFVVYSDSSLVGLGDKEERLRQRAQHAAIDGF